VAYINRPPIFSCCTIPLHYDDDNKSDAGGDGGVGDRPTSAVVCVGGEGVRVVPILAVAGSVVAAGVGGGRGSSGSNAAGLHSGVFAVAFGYSLSLSSSLSLCVALARTDACSCALARCFACHLSRFACLPPSHLLLAHKRLLIPNNVCM